MTSVFLVALVLMISLAIWFIFFSDASVRAKVIVGLLFALSFALRFSRFAMAGFLLQVALSIFIAVYLKVQSG